MSRNRNVNPESPGYIKPKESRYEKRPRGSSNSSIRWVDADASSLHDAVCAVTDNGEAIILSRTSDGGALSITIISGSDKHRWYPNSVAMIEEDLAEILELARAT